jgi:hypothetical protein
MLAHTQLVQPGPEEYKENLDAPLTPFFEAWADELGGSPAERMRKVKKMVKSRYGRTRLRLMLKLTDTQFEGVLRDCECDPYFRLVTEEYLGAKFVKAAVPDSAALVPSIARVAEVDLPVRQEKKGKKGTVSAKLDSYESVLLPAESLAVIETPNLAVNTFKPGEMQKSARETAAAFFCEFGELAIGISLLRRLAGQLSIRAPHCPLKGKVPKLMNWEHTLANVFENWARPDARVRAKQSTHTRTASRLSSPALSVH